MRSSARSPGRQVGSWALVLVFCLAPGVARAQEGGLECAVDGRSVALSWNIQFLVPIAGFRVLRDGAEIATLDPQATEYLDEEAPLGEHLYELAAENLDGSVGVVARCEVVVGDLGLKCALEGSGVHMEWGPVLITVVFDRFVIRRDGEIIASVAPSVLEYTDPDPPGGVHRYTVHAEMAPGDEFLVGSCSIEVPFAGFQCTVRPPHVVVDWSQVPPSFRCGGERCLFDFYRVIRNGEIIAELPPDILRYVDLPGPGLHHYAVVAGFFPPDETTDPPLYLIGECRVEMPSSEVPPPVDLTCRLVCPATDTGEDPTDPAAGDDGSPSRCAVLLNWTNGADYDRILIYRNNMQIAALPGGTESYTDPLPFLAGRILYSVIGVIGSRRSDAATCEVEVLPPWIPPPQDLRCAVISVSAEPVDPVTGIAADDGLLRVAVLMSWVNPVRYASIIVERDGVAIARLPGDAMTYRDIDPPAGLRVYAVRGVAASGAESRRVRCEVVVPRLPVPPVRDLTCVALESDAADGAAAQLRWQPGIGGSAYTAIDIWRDGARIARLPGDATHYIDRGLAPGLYLYGVIAWIGEDRSPAAECRVLIPGVPPGNLLYFSSGRFVVDPATGEAVEVEENAQGGLSCVADNVDPIQGWSFGVCFDPRLLSLVEADIAGTATAGLNDGEGPTFLSIRRFDEGVAMAVIVDELDPTDTLPAGDEQRLLRLRFTAGPEGEPGGIYPLSYCDSLGDPPVSVLFVVEGFEVIPRTATGWVRLPPLIPPPILRGDSNGDGAVDISDPMTTLGWLFLGSEEPGCVEQADANASREVNIADPIYTLQFLFVGGPPPPAPYPECGVVSRLFLGCREPSCPQPVAAEELAAP
ncbi:MAG: hypothetical protein JXA90_12695 [Planctomycetes bacterium]|nr:hypothetical protein [Planctomycetota bacterium]